MTRPRSPERQTGTTGPARAAAASGLALLFLAGTFASAAGLHGCPQAHHASPPAPGTDARSHGSAGTTGDAGPGDEEHGEACTCLGDCQSAAPTALHRPAPRAAPDAEPPVPLRRADRERPGPRRSPEYFLPYPLGPPSA